MADIQKFAWKGINKQGTRLSGVINASDIKAAEAEIKNKDIELISIEPKRQFSFSFRRKKISSREVVLFTRYLSTMLTAGLPILQSLDIIAKDQENEMMRTVVVSLRNSVAAGTPFADALSQHPEYFSELYCNLARTGEKSATLDKVLSRLSKYLERMEAIRRKVKNALIYPITIVLVALAVSLVLLIFVIPQFQTMFENAGAKLPYFTQIVIYISNFIRHFWWFVILLVIFGLWLFINLRRRNPYFADIVDVFILKIYVIGPILRKAIIARFSRTLSITLDAGLPIVDAMKSMINIMGNRTYKKGVTEICESISTGHQLSSSMEATKLFPNMVIQMVSVGEASGELASMLNNIANYYEEEVNTIADNLSTLLEPIIIVILGIIIGCFVIAMYLPIFKLGTTI